MESEDKKIQETYLEFQAIDQNIKHLQRQLDAVTHQLIELSVTSSSLDDFGKIKPAKEVFVPLSSGIYAKANLANSSELLVNVGANIVVRKDLASAKKLIEHQLDEIKKIHAQLLSELEKMARRAASLERQLQDFVGQKE